jgi:hypothetical protein
MNKKECEVCNKLFTRQWNLERHMQDIHHISEHGENERINQEYEDPPYSNPSTIRNEQFRTHANRTIEIDYSENPHQYHNVSNHYSSKDSYNNRVYENFEPFPMEKKEKKLTITDRMKLIRGLQFLKNFLPRIYPNHVVIQQIYWLNYLCYTQNSIQPLRDFFKKYNLMHLWLS